MMYVEIWEVSGNAYGDRLEIAYSEEEFNDVIYRTLKREAMEELHNCKLKRRLRLDTIDIEEFKEG